MTQTLHIHLEEYAPGGHNQKHGHVNEAAFYILDGEGYEIHDGIRYDWKAGDVVVVHNNCVHQHFNASTDQAGARARDEDEADVLFMNMLFQKQVEPRPTEPAPAPRASRARGTTKHELQSRVSSRCEREPSENANGARDALVSDDLAKKFASEKDTPYTRWVQAEGLDIISSFYVPDLHTVELKPWAAPRRTRSSSSTTMRRARRTTATSARFRRARSWRPSASSTRR